MLDKFTQHILRALYRSQGTRVYREDWNYLIILDACRYDVFLKISKELPIEGVLEFRFSLGSSTLEFFRKNFLTGNYYRDIVYVTANPTINYILNKYKRRVFYKVVPVWLYAWDKSKETVLPSSMYYWSLRTFINYPKKRIIFHFLQPHYPFIGEKYYYLNLIIREEMKRARISGLNIVTNKYIVHKRFTVYINLIYSIIRNGALAAPAELYLNKNVDIKEVIKAYFDNLRRVLSYAIKLAKVLPGKVVITADHGEAFGERLHPLLPIRVYGHPSSVHIELLVKVPWLVINNINKRLKDSMREVLREIISLKLKRR